MFGIPVFFQAVDKVFHHFGEGVGIDISAFFYAGINGEKFFLFLKTPQEEAVIEDGSIFSEQVDIGSIGNKSGSRSVPPRLSHALFLSFLHSHHYPY